MPQCAVVGCNSSHRKTKGGSIRYHRFPGDATTRARWVQTCGKSVQNCSTARICSRHFTVEHYERDVQHELLGLPTRCRLRKGAVPDRNLPGDFLKEDVPVPSTAIDILLAVGLVPAKAEPRSGLPQDLTKMQIMEDVREGCNVQPSSPGHAEERSEETEEKNGENGFEETSLPAEDDGKKQDKEPKDELENGEKEESNSSDEVPKRKSESQEGITKRLRVEIQDSFMSRDKILNEFLELADCNNTDQIQVQAEQILSEIRTLNELAKEKEREWNNIIHLKKMKEELLLRMQRRKQIMMMGDKAENGDDPQAQILKGNLSSTGKIKLQNRHRTILPKPSFNPDMNGLDFRQNKQRNVVDVQSIIADYRQRHPETVPRRGRRIRNAHIDPKGNNNILNFSSLALGSGAQVQQNLDAQSDLGMLLETNRNDGSRPSSAESSQNLAEPSFKDMLVQFAKLSQSERHELLQNAIKPPPPYPEVTVHPVPTTSAPPTNSLLHGILTKSPPKGSSKTSFSPTLARLLTAPERSSTHSPTLGNLPTNMSISEILSTSKARNEITITPVGQYEAGKGKMDEDEAEDSADRLVIDESSEIIDARIRGDNSSDAGDEAPQCQGCQQKSALFVCAGCGNQWYCSRECQVTAWDEHSEVCSG